MIATRVPAGLLRRLGATLSDSLVVFALLALVTLIVFVPILNSFGKKVMSPADVGWFLYSVYVLSLLALWFGFYGFFWGRSGQTIGMRAWRIRVESNDGALLTWGESLKRWGLAWLPWVPGLITLGFAERLESSVMKIAGQGLLLLGVMNLLVMYRNPERLAWHDRTSESRMIVLPKL